MQGCLYLAAKSIGLSTRGGRKPVGLLQAARHTLREKQNERGGRGNVDPDRTPRNRVMVGPDNAQDLVSLAQSIAAAADINLSEQRKDYCQAVELLFSLPSATHIQPEDYFSLCVQWAQDRFGKNSVMSAVAHYDESAPHLHVLISPIVNGKLRGSALIDRKALWQMKESFSRSVAAPFGLELTTRLTGPAKATAIRAVLAALNASDDGAMRSATWQTIRRAIESDPVPFAHELGINIDSPVKKKGRTMTQIFISPGRGPKTERVAALRAAAA